ncbi:MAG: metal-dependent hydrolase, partial [Myxococcota bacterium]
EGSHGHEHEKAFRVLESQGFEIQSWLDYYENSAFEKIEKRFPPNLRLAATAALEHLTATLAEQGLTTTELDNAHPIMRDLLRWHACEEIEHKSVAFDVLKKVDDRYWVRVAGMVIGLASLLYYWRSASQMLMEQDGVTKAQAKRERAAAAARGQNRNYLWRGFVEYLRPSFHPDDNDNYHLAEAYLAKIGRLEG